MKSLLRFASLLSVVLAFVQLSAAPAMTLGANFWNLGWHKAGDCFQNLQQVSGDNPWNTQFLREIAIYRSLRFMDWDNTNNSQRENWSQRPARDTARQNPVAYEWMIDLCNRNGSDLWITVPHRTVSRTSGDAPADYALRLSVLVKTGVDLGAVDLTPLMPRLAAMTADDLVRAGGVKRCAPLKPDLKFFLEYSNETWNGQFKQSHYCAEEGEALKLHANKWTAGMRFHAWAALRLFRAADLVFGVDAPRVVKLLAGHSANSFVALQHLLTIRDAATNPWGTKATAYATAPYFGNKLAGDDPAITSKLREAIQKSARDAEKHHQLVTGAGLRLIAYEGGQHVVSKADVINRQPVMHTLTTEYLREMSRYFDHFCYYAHVGGAKDRGAWGAIEYTGQPLAEAHRYRALVDWVKR